jgi:hypothetical protein
MRLSWVTLKHNPFTIFGMARNMQNSGTTIIAAENTGRNSIGIEKDAEIFATMQRRLEARLL